jgi:hypothetical protein
MRCFAPIVFSLFALTACGTYQEPDFSQADATPTPTPAPRFQPWQPAATPAPIATPVRAAATPTPEPVAAPAPQTSIVDAVGSLPACDDEHAGWVVYVSTATIFKGCVDHSWVDVKAAVIPVNPDAEAAAVTDGADRWIVVSPAADRQAAVCPQGWSLPVTDAGRIPPVALFDAAARTSAGIALTYWTDETGLDGRPVVGSMTDHIFNSVDAASLNAVVCWQAEVVQ